MQNKISLFTGLTFLVPSVTWAFVFSPISVSFDPSGPGATRSFQLENDSKGDMAIEVSIATRTVNLDGKEINEKTAEIENQFLIYPPQLLLKSKEKRTVRVSWVGDKNPKSELAFRIIAEQLPVQTEKSDPKAKGAVIKMLLKYVGAIYITPTGAKPELVVQEAKPLIDKQSSLSITIQNKGTEHKILSNLSLKLTPVSAHKSENLGKNTQNPASSIFLQPKQIKEISAQNLLAGATQRFTIPWPQGLPQGPVHAELEFKD